MINVLVEIIKELKESLSDVTRVSDKDSEAYLIAEEGLRFVEEIEKEEKLSLEGICSMPIYTYLCSFCGAKFEKLVREHSESGWAFCEECSGFSFKIPSKPGFRKDHTVNED